MTVPTIAEIADQILASIQTKLNQTVPSSPKSFFRVLSYAMAGAVWLLYRFVVWAEDQIFPQTASAARLTLIGEQYGIVRTAASAWSGTATATGENGTLIPGGTLWTANGVVYQQTGDATLAPNATITLTSLQAGASTSLEVGAELRLVSPIGGASDLATVASVSLAGADQESDANYRSRVIDRLKRKPQGGAIADYVAWAREVPGIVKAFAYNTGAGQVTVYPLAALSGNRIPSPAKVTEVQSYVSSGARKPLVASVLAVAPTEKTLDVTVTALTPNTALMKSKIQDAWTSFALRAFPQQYADEPKPTNVVSVALLTAEAIGAGAQAITLTMNPGGGAVPSYTLANSEIIKLGTITWPV